MTDKGGRDALLAYTVNFLREKNSNELRTEVILKETHTSFSSLYHHFGSRENLIRTAHLELCREFFITFSNNANELFSKVTSFEEFAQLYSSIVHERGTNPVHLLNRKRQANLIGAAFSDLELKHELSKIFSDTVDSIIPIFQRLQVQGIINPKANLKVILSANLALIHSRVFMEVDPLTTSYYPDWNRMLIYTFLLANNPNQELTWNPAWALRINNPIPVEDRPLLPKDEVSLNSENWTPVKIRILQSAIHEFSNTPFSEIRLSTIAKNIEVAPSLIYKYFKDKEELYLYAKIFRYTEQNMKKRAIFNEREKIKTAKEFKAYLKELFIAHQSAPESEREYDPVNVAKARWEILGESIFRDDVKEQIVKFSRQNAYTWYDWLLNLQEKKIINNEINTFSYVFWLVSVYQAFPLYELILGEDHEIEDVTKGWWNFILNQR